MGSRRGWVLVAALVLAGASPAMGSGFSIYEQSAKASGQAGAWVARADDAAASWYNPAALTRLEGMQLQLGANLITIGIDTSLTSSDPAFGLTSQRKFDSVRDDTTPINLYYAWRIDDRFSFGFGFNNPFGLATEWKDRPVTFSSKRVELATFVANPNLAYRIDARWSVAVGLDYLYADVGEFSKEFDQGLINPALAGQIGTSNLKGTGSAWGFNVAAQFASKDWAAGLTYRGALSPEIDGNVEFANVAPPVEGLFPNGPGKTTLDLPAEAAAGVAYTGFEGWQLELDLSWAQWSNFEKLVIDFRDETLAVQDVTLDENWGNTFAVRLGAAWKVAPKHEVRLGALWDKNPIPDENLRPSIPDGDRWSVTLGYGFTAARWSIDAYYMPLFFQTRNANGDALAGVIDGRYESFVHLFGVGVGFRF